MDNPPPSHQKRHLPKRTWQAAQRENPLEAGMSMIQRTSSGISSTHLACTLAFVRGFRRKTHTYTTGSVFQEREGAFKQKAAESCCSLDLGTVTRRIMGLQLQRPSRRGSPGRGALQHRPRGRGGGLTPAADAGHALPPAAQSREDDRQTGRSEEVQGLASDDRTRQARRKDEERGIQRS